jgi:Rrf2 family protein
MLLSQTSEYALRAMSWLASAPPDVPIRARDLSEGSGIPPHYLSKVLRRLVLADLLVSQKGQGGGFVLARAPGEIRFLDILAAVDAYPTEGRCAFGWGACNETNPCPLHETWSELNDTIRDWAATSTLADVQRVMPQSPWSGRPPPEGPATSG